MTSIVDISELRKRKDDQKKLEAVVNLLDAGMSKTDVAILSLATNRAFDGTNVPSLDEAAKMGFKHLRSLHISRELLSNDIVFDIGTKAKTVIHYVITDQARSFAWGNEGSTEPLIETNLSTDDDPGLTVANFLCGQLQVRLGRLFPELREEELAISLYGQFAIDVFYQACCAPYNPVFFQYFPDTGLFGLVLYDPERKIDVALISHIDTYAPSEEDFNATERLPS